jgi:hypothetical protein
MLGHISGDAGLEVGASADGKSASGALLVATDDEHTMRSFLDQAMPTLLANDTSSTYTIGHESYHGVDISEARPSSGGTTVPSWTVDHGTVIIATNPSEAKAIIDTANGGRNLAGSSGYRQQLGGHIKNNGELYIDVQKVIADVRAGMTGPDRDSFDHDLLPNLRPIQAIVYSQTNSSDHSSGHLLVAVS